MRRLPLLLLLLALVLAGCGGDPDTAEDTSGRGDVALTPRALAWLTAEHLGTPDSATADDDLEELGDDTVGTELRYGTTGEYDGDAVNVGVTRALPPELLDCDAPDNDYLDGCEEIADGVLLQWQEEEPEEDPGVLYVLVTKDDVSVVVLQSSEPITGDPREVDLTISVDDMVELAQDPRVDLSTTQEAVDQGGRLDYWSDGSDG